MECASLLERRERRRESAKVLVPSLDCVEISRVDAWQHCEGGEVEALV